MLFIFSFQYRTRNNRFASLFGVCQIRQHPLIFFFFVFHTKKASDFYSESCFIRLIIVLFSILYPPPCFPHLLQIHTISHSHALLLFHTSAPTHSLHLIPRSLLLHSHAPYFSVSSLSTHTLSTPLLLSSSAQYPLSSIPFIIFNPLYVRLSTPYSTHILYTHSAFRTYIYPQFSYQQGIDF